MDRDAFQAGYVSSELGCRGIRVLGGFASAEEAIQALQAEPNIRAAIVAQATHVMASPLVDALKRRNVPYLLLLPSNTMKHETEIIETPVLAKPFAAYQVADWVSGILGGI